MGKPKHGLKYPFHIGHCLFYYIYLIILVALSESQKYDTFISYIIYVIIHCAHQPKICISHKLFEYEYFCQAVQRICVSNNYLKWFLTCCESIKTCCDVCNKN